MKTTVPDHEAGERLDAWLTQRFPELSRSAYQKLIQAGEVLVNDKPAKANRVLREGDTVELRSVEVPKKAVSTEAFPEVKVVDETEEYLVIEKPSGLLVHPAPDQETSTLVDFLLKHAPGIKVVGDAAERPGIVHRLDREASGLMVVAKTQRAFDDLKRQFQEHLIKKEYLALAYGPLSRDFGIIDAPIGRKKGKGRMSARAEAQEGDREAKSHFDVIERFPQATLVKVRTETGRMHQVRVHLKSIGHPLVGDDLYAGTKHRTPSLAGTRLFLHAATLGFNDLAGAWHEFHSELPPDLDAVLAKLRSRHAKKRS